MRAEIVKMSADNLNIEAIRKAGTILKEGGLVAFPTETVYGLGGNALDPEASMKIYAAKGRPSDNPLIVHIAEMGKLSEIAAEIPGKGEASGTEILAGTADDDSAQSGGRAERDDRRTGQCGGAFPQ